MIRLAVTVWLVLTAVILAGCSNQHYADLDQLRQQRLAADESRPQRSKSRPRRETTSRAVVTPDDVASTGTVGRTRDIKPWPKTGTPEWHQLQVEEAERERRIRDAVNSICRGC
jgi:hypothetical protein